MYDEEKKFLKELGLYYLGYRNVKCNIIKSFDWNFVLFQAIKHNLLGLLWEVLTCNELIKEIPFFLKQFLSQQSLLIKEKNQIYCQKLNELGKLLNKDNISYAVVKGIVIDQLLYGGKGVKGFSDIDILIDSNDSNKVHEVLLNNHFCYGYYNDIKHKVEEHPRDKVLLYKLTKDHVGEYVYITNSTVIPVVKIDISTDIDWLSTNKVELDLSDDSSILLDNVVIKTLNLEMHFLYLILHIYRHANSKRFSIRGINVKLMMMDDLVLFYIKYKDTLVYKFKETFKENTSIHHRVLWVLRIAERIYNLSIIDTLKINPISKFNMDEYEKKIECRTFFDFEGQLWL